MKANRPALGEGRAGLVMLSFLYRHRYASTALGNRKEVISEPFGFAVTKTDDNRKSNPRTLCIGLEFHAPAKNSSSRLASNAIICFRPIPRDRIEPREILNLTVVFDHDVADGAPAARFVWRLVELIESGYGPG